MTETTEAARVLIVDDEPMVRRSVERALSPAYVVRGYASGEELDQALEPFHPDLIILDVHMPKEDGWHLCHRLRQGRRFDDVPIIFLSAFCDESAVRKGYSSGGDFYMPKPFDIHELMKVVDALTGRKHRYPNE